MAEPQILAKLQSELLKPAVTDYVAESVNRELRRTLAAAKDNEPSTQHLLEQERRKLQNLIAAIEGGSDAPATLLEAVKEREATLKRLESQLKRESQKPVPGELPDAAIWVREQLENLTALLKTDPLRVKSEFRRLNLQLTFNPIEAQPRDHYVVKGQCDLSALVFFYFALAIPGCGSGLNEDPIDTVILTTACDDDIFESRRTILSSLRRSRTISLPAGPVRPGLLSDGCIRAKVEVWLKVFHVRTRPDRKASIRRVSRQGSNVAMRYAGVCTEPHRQNPTESILICMPWVTIRRDRYPTHQRLEVEPPLL